MTKGSNGWMKTETCFELYHLLCAEYGSERVKLVIEFAPKSVIHMIDNEPTAQATLERLREEAKS